MDDATRRQCYEIFVDQPPDTEEGTERVRLEVLWGGVEGGWRVETQL